MYVIIEVVEVDRADLTRGGYLLPKKVIGPFESYISAYGALASLQVAHQNDPVDFTIVWCTAIEQYCS